MPKVNKAGINAYKSITLINYKTKEREIDQFV